MPKTEVKHMLACPHPLHHRSTTVCCVDWACLGFDLLSLPLLESLKSQVNLILKMHTDQSSFSLATAVGSEDAAVARVLPRVVF